VIAFLARSYQDRNGPRTREEILNLLRKEPGLTKTQLCRKLDLAWGTIYYHLRLLRDDRELVERSAWGRRRFYTMDTPSPEALLLPLLRDVTVPQILAAVSESPGIGIGDLSEHLALSRKVVRRHLAALVRSGILTRTPQFRAQYFLSERYQAQGGARSLGSPEAGLTPKHRIGLQPRNDDPLTRH
jgi:DNA-binding transcriptional ArsR family regulator